MQSRMSTPGKFVPGLQEVAAGLGKAIGNGSLPGTAMGLVGLRVAQIVGNSYLTSRTTLALRDAGETEERITAVASWRDSPRFTDAERAALALGEAVFTPNPQGERVPDELYAEAARHFDEKELATLMVAIGQVSFYVALALIGKPVPDVPFSESWTDPGYGVVTR